MLHGLHRDRPAAALDVEQALHLQQVGAAQRDQRLDEAAERVPRRAAVFGQHEMRDAVAERRCRERRCSTWNSAPSARSVANVRRIGREVFAGLDRDAAEWRCSRSASSRRTPCRSDTDRAARGIRPRSAIVFGAEVSTHDSP